MQMQTTLGKHLMEMYLVTQFNLIIVVALPHTQHLFQMVQQLYLQSITLLQTVLALALLLLIDGMLQSMVRVLAVIQ